MIEIFKALSLISLTLSSVYIALLLRPPRGQLHKAYALFLLALSVPLAYNYLRLNGWPQASVIEAFAHSMLLAYGPILWSIVRISVKKPVQYIYWQALPFTAIALYKLFYYQGELSIILSAVFFAHIAVYAYLTLRDLLRYKRMICVVIQNFPFTQHYWLVWLAGGIAAIELLDITLITLYMQGVSINLLLWQSVMFGLVFYTLVIVLISFLSPSWLIFNESQRKGTDALISERATSTDHPIQQAEPGRRVTELHESTAHDLVTVLTDLMTKQGIYQQNDLALDDLAQHLGISRHQTSELLNVHIGEPFYDYINRHRIEHACSLLTNHSVKLPILQIAFESGFNNKNSFYKSFKTAKGCTPSEYRKIGEHPPRVHRPITALSANSQ